MDSEDKFKKSVQTVSPDQREGVIKLRDLLKTYRDRGDILLPLYHIEDNWIELLTLNK